MPIAKSIAVVGTGCAGMAAMLGLAELGWGVNAYDGVPGRVRKLQQGTSPYREPGLEDVLRTHLGNGRLALCESLAGATKGVEAIVVAVPTPHREDGSTDLNGLTAAIEALARQHLSTWPTVIVSRPCRPARATGSPSSCAAGASWSTRRISARGLGASRFPPPGSHRRRL